MDKSGLEKIFENDEFGLLEESASRYTPVTDEDRLIDSFEEINRFYDEHQREPSADSLSEYSLYSRLDKIRNDEETKALLEVFDRHDLLYDKKVPESIEEVLSDDDFGLLDGEGDSSIFDFKHVPKPGSRAEAEYIAQRKKMSEHEFRPYEKMFMQVQQDLREGRRKLVPFSRAEQNLKEGHFYLVNGLLAYLKVSDAEEVLKENRSGDRIRLDGRTWTIFENGTQSNMLFRSLAKAIQKNGAIVTETAESEENELFASAGVVEEEDIEAGWIYVLKSKSDLSQIQEIPDLYKIGFTKHPVSERIKNATNDPSFLFSDVEVIATYKCYSLNIRAFENLLHRFFGKSCLDIDLYDREGVRYAPREWFVIPFKVIDEAIELVMKNKIYKYIYDQEKMVIIPKPGKT